MKKKVTYRPVMLMNKKNPAGVFFKNHAGFKALAKAAKSAGN